MAGARRHGPPCDRERLAQLRKAALGIPDTDEGRIWLPLKQPRAPWQLIEETTTSHTPIIIASEGKPHVALVPFDDLIVLQQFQ